MEPVTPPNIGGKKTDMNFFLLGSDGWEFSDETIQLFYKFTTVTKHLAQVHFILQSLNLVLDLTDYIKKEKGLHVTCIPLC